MERFISWFNRTAPGREKPLSALTRAGIAHLYFESIHPFEDGNGRIGRAIAEKALAQSLGQPTLTAAGGNHSCSPQELLRSARSGEQGK
jgi:Fic family protein